MPKKMKKSVGKSDEERQVHLQQRAQAEEELKKKKEETLGLFLKDKLQKEQRNTALNLLKLHDGWRVILRQTRDAELRHDIIVLQQTFERTLDNLNSIIEKLVGDVQETERQEAHMRCCHLHHMEALWALQAARLHGLQQQWERALQDVSASVSSQSQQMLEQSQQQDFQLQELALRAEWHNTDAMNDIRMLFEDTLAMYACSLEEQVAALEGREEVSDATQTSLEHLQKSIVKATQLEKLLADNQKKISEDLKTTKKLEDSVRGLREKLTFSKVENSLMEEHLTAAINELSHRSHALRDHLTRAHKEARKRLTELTVQGDAAAKKLQAVVTKGERVLRAADICHRLETKHDTLLTSSSSRPTDECRQDTPAKIGSALPNLCPVNLIVASSQVGLQLLKHVKAPCQEAPPPQDICRFPELQQQLRQSISGSVLQREALRKHREELRRENEQLRFLLHQHEHDTHPSPLHVARAPTATTTTLAARGRSCVTVIEAAHAVLKQ